MAMPMGLKIGSVTDLKNGRLEIAGLLSDSSLSFIWISGWSAYRKYDFERSFMTREIAIGMNVLGKVDAMSN